MNHRRAGWCGLLAFAGVMLALITAMPAAAVQPDEMLPDVRLEARARVLSRELRCMVCQNQSIDDSDAPLARDIRILVRERLTAGDTDAQILDFLVARYGQFVLLKPRFELETALLWLTPLLVLLIGVCASVFAWRRRMRSGADTAGTETLTAAEQQAIARITASEKRP